MSSKNMGLMQQNLDCNYMVILFLVSENLITFNSIKSQSNKFVSVVLKLLLMYSWSQKFLSRNKFDGSIY